MSDSDTSKDRICPSCKATTSETALNNNDYRCPQCNFEMAHLDTAPNGSIRGVFGYLLSVDEKVQDRYLIQSVLGKGGFGATYLVEDLKLKGKRRALKEVPELLFDEHEVSVLSQLNHPTVPDIIDRFISNGMVYLILEFGGRHTLGSECRKYGGRMPLPKSVPIMRQLCDALAYLHSQDPPIIHRDLKPDNILLDDSDRIMLIDFGISKESSQSTTRMMARAASHGFSPPEQVLGTGTDERSDIYSFGATLYFLITGEIPTAAHERVAGKELAPPSSFVESLPPEIDEIILSTLSLNINQRPARIDDLRYMVDTLSNMIVPEMSNTSQTMRLGPSTEGFATPHPRLTGTGSVGIRIATSDPIPGKTGGVSEPKKRNLVPIVAIVSVAVAVAIAAYFLFRDQGSTTRQVTQAPPATVQKISPAVPPGTVRQVQPAAPPAPVQQIPPAVPPATVQQIPPAVPPMPYSPPVETSVGEPVPTATFQPQAQPDVQVAPSLPGVGTTSEPTTSAVTSTPSVPPPATGQPSAADFLKNRPDPSVTTTSDGTLKQGTKKSSPSRHGKGGTPPPARNF